MNKKQKGYLGEKKACKFLIGKGYNVITVNFRGPVGEIDIIAYKNNKLIFIEVKTWDYYSEESLRISINKKKQNKIIQTAKYFLLNNSEFSEWIVRFDVIFIKNELKEILHIKQAFGE